MPQLKTPPSYGVSLGPVNYMCSNLSFASSYLMTMPMLLPYGRFSISVNIVYDSGNFDSPNWFSKVWFLKSAMSSSSFFSSTWRFKSGCVSCYWFWLSCPRDLMVKLMNFYFSDKLIELYKAFVFWLNRKLLIKSSLCVSNTKLPRRIR